MHVDIHRYTRKLTASIVLERVVLILIHNHRFMQASRSTHNTTETKIYAHIELILAAKKDT